MQPASARALTITAALVLLVGFLVPSPSGAFFAFCLAVLLTLFPVIRGTGAVRLVAAILLLCSAGFAAGGYPDFQSDQERYRQRPRATVSEQPPAP